MVFRFLILSVMLAVLLTARLAQACDPNEECNRCLASAFDHCITTGNDPVCEARKAACQIAPPVVNTPGSPFGPGGPLQQGGPLGLSIPQVQQCISNLSACPAQIIARIGYESVRPIVNQYIGFLQNQAGNNVYALDENFIASIQRFYQVNLHAVRYATNINTIHGANITIGNTIFFVRNIDFNDENDAQLVYHELEHVVQYARRGGVEPFLAEYILKAGGSILRGGNSIDMHDNIDLERDAINKASEVSAAMSSGSNSSQSAPVLPDRSQHPHNKRLEISVEHRLQLAICRDSDQSAQAAIAVLQAGQPYAPAECHSGIDRARAAGYDEA